MFHKHFCFLLLLFSILQSSLLLAQVGGQRIFEFQNVPATARVAALGGMNISLKQEDATMFFQNPALLDSSMIQKLSFTYNPYFAEIRQFTASYAFQTKKLGVWAIGIQDLSYGSFDQRDPSGLNLGQFRANDFAINIAKSHRLGNFTLGANLKWLGSQIESFNAHALVLDIGGIFQHPEKDLVVALTFKNIGFLVSDYTELSTSQVPWDIRLGLSFKPQFMPLRFSFTFYELHQWDIGFQEPNDESVKEITFLDNFFRHMTFGGEFTIHKNFNLRIGYNHLRNRELQVENGSRFAGFSAGLMLNVKSIRFEFSRAAYQALGARNWFTLTTDLSKKIRKLKK